MAYTPGPWRIAEDIEITTSPVGIIEGSKRIADCGNPLRPPEEVKANARLISMAPELYETLKIITDKYMPFMWNDDITKSLEVLRKAEGVLIK